MQIEYEIKVLDIDQDNVAKSLLDLGFEQQKPQSFRRYVYQLSGEGSWIRLRTDGHTTKLTYKRFEKNSVDGMKELEIKVSDFDKTHELLQVLGFDSYIYQENRRTNFINGGVEISIDEWPLIPPYLEIEGKDQESVEKYLEKLGLTDKRKTSEPTSEVYKLYGYDINSYQKLSF